MNNTNGMKNTFARIRGIMIVFLHSIILPTYGWTQTSSQCTPTLSEDAAIEIVQQKGMLLQPAGWTYDELKKIPSMKPSALFDSAQCLWIITSKTYKVTHRGSCKKTNGCTIEYTQKVTLSESTQKIIRKKKYRTKYPNYE